jgi:Protein of unknown function (DUF3592)
MKRFFIGLSMFCMGAFLFYSGVVGMVKPVLYAATGVHVQGEIVGFWAGRSNPSIQKNASGLRASKQKNRKPAYRYPIAVGAKDSLTGKNTVAPLLWNSFEQGDKVTVVFPKEDPSDAWILDYTGMGRSVVFVLVGCLFMYISIRNDW